MVGGSPDERGIVVDCSTEALRHGVRVGMPLREALSRCREAVFLNANHPHYHQVATAMHQALGSISPLVEPAELGQAFVGLGGLGTGPDAEALLARRMARAVKQSTNLLPRVGIADGKFAALVAAMMSRREPQFIAAGQAPQFLAEVPTTYLPVSLEMQRKLRMLGMRNLGQIAAMPLAAMQAQFGHEGRLAWELANGTDKAPLIPLQHPSVLLERLEFQTAITSQEALLMAAKYLLQKVTAHPEFAYHATRGLVFRAMLTNRKTWERGLIFREPLTTHDQMFFALKAKLDSITLPAAVEGVEIELVDICGECGIQGNLFTSQRGQQLSRVDTVVRQLISRYGESPISKIMEVEPWSRIPERRFALIEYTP